MIGDHDLIAFVATARPDEAARFYRDVLGLALLEDTPFALVFSDQGRMLRIQKVEAHSPAQHTVLGWAVPDIAAEIEALIEKGVTFRIYPRLGQDALGIWTTPDGHKVAWFSDPDGNNLSVTEFAR